MAVPITTGPPPFSGTLGGTTTGKKARTAAAKSVDDRTEFEKKLISTTAPQQVAISSALHHTTIYTIHRTHVAALALAGTYSR